MLRSCRTAKVADGKGKRDAYVRVRYVYVCMMKATWGCTRQLQVRVGICCGPEMGYWRWETAHGICEMTGQKKMGKSDDEMRKTSRQKQQEERPRRKIQ